MSYRSGFVALVGRPNTGKSTLINQLVGQKISIVSEKPQTTRNRIMGICHLPETQIIFFDTPGLHHANIALNRKMVRSALSCLCEVDLILHLVEPIPPAQEDAWIAHHLHSVKTPKVLAVNKIDLLASHNSLLPILDAYNLQKIYADLVPISAKTRENTPRLLSTICKHLPVGEALFPEDTVTDQPVRLLAAEIVREKAIRATRQEIPYVIAVEIETFEESDSGITIHALLFVERDSQKGILIGHRGSMLKDIGTRARQELSGLLGKPVFLGLWVKVKPDWRENDAFLKQMGYG